MVVQKWKVMFLKKTCNIWSSFSSTIGGDTRKIFT